MTPIRPGYPQFTPQPQPQSAGGRSAIFELARAQAAAKAAPAETAAPTRQPTQVNRVAETVDEAPAKVLRPGSLVDIRV